jgi:peroxiredoxin
MTLNAQLKAVRRAVAENADPGVLRAFSRADAALRSSGILDRCRKAGDRMPEFTLPDANGRTVAFSSLLLRGPVVVSFFRGDWCDYCALELSALATVHSDICELGASLVAISPQSPDTRVRTDLLDVPFPLLWDANAKVARRCGITYTLPAALRPIYSGAGLRPHGRGEEGWRLPLPATYIADWTGRIVLSWLNTDYTSRLEPGDIVTTLSHLRRQAARSSRPFKRRLHPGSGP